MKDVRQQKKEYTLDVYSQINKAEDVEHLLWGPTYYENKTWTSIVWKQRHRLHD